MTGQAGGDGVATTVTNRIVELAEKAGLHPTWKDTYRGARTIILTGDNPWDPFGAIYVGASSGRVLRATIAYGNDGEIKTYTGAQEVRAALRELVQTKDRPVSSPIGPQTTG